MGNDRLGYRSWGFILYGFFSHAARPPKAGTTVGLSSKLSFKAMEGMASQAFASEA